MSASEAAGMVSSMNVEVTHQFASPIRAVWDLLSDVERMAGLGPEHAAAVWVGDLRGVGARFDGTNRREDMEWTVPCYITEWTPPNRLGWSVLEPDNPSSIWSYTLRPDSDGTEVTQRFAHGPNISFVRMWAEEKPNEAAGVIASRADMLRADMHTTLRRAADLLT